MSNTNMTSLKSGTNGTSSFGQFILPSNGSASHSPKSHVSKAKIGGAAEPEDIVRGIPLIFTSRNGAWYHSCLEEIKTNSKSRFCLDAVMKLQLAIDSGIITRQPAQMPSTPTLERKMERSWQRRSVQEFSLDFRQKVPNSQGEELFLRPPVLPRLRRIASLLRAT
jgi:hypothetical protein